MGKARAGTLLILKPTPDCHEWAQVLNAQGFAAMPLPTVAVTPDWGGQAVLATHIDAYQTHRYPQQSIQGIIVSSKWTPALLAPDLLQSLLKAFSHVPFYVIGDTTAQALLAKAGSKLTLSVAPEANAQALAQLIYSDAGKGAHFWHLTGGPEPSPVSAAMAALNLTVSPFDVYQRQPKQVSLDEINWSNTQAFWVGSAALWQAFEAQLSETQRSIITTWPAWVPSQRVASVLKQSGMQHIHVAKGPGLNALQEAARVTEDLLG